MAWEPTKEQRKNLETLAEKLPGVPEEQFRMQTYQSVFDAEKFRDKHPRLFREYYDEEWGELDFVDRPNFVIQHGCGTSGCALGWAPALVKKGLPKEDFDEYCERVFGVDPESLEWYYMFGHDWYGEHNTPAATAKRIEYVLENACAPDDWRRHY